MRFGGLAFIFHKKHLKRYERFNYRKPRSSYLHTCNLPLYCNKRTKKKMTTEQAVKIIKINLEVFMDSVPQPLLDKIESVINKTRTIVQKEIILENRLEEKPDLQKEWLRICKIHQIDPETAKRGRHYEKVRAKVHFIRHVLLNYKYITLMEIARFLKCDHTSVIALRDRSKVECVYPPFYQRKRVIINAQGFIR